MSGELVRASDAEREGSVVLLREHFVEGRLTLEEFVERVNALYEATTLTELEAPLRDLQVASAARRGVTRFVLALFGSSEREGRLRVRRRVLCLAGFGNIDLDLRQATFDRDRVTILLLGAFSALDVYVPEGVDVDLHGLVVFGHRSANGNDPPPRARNAARARDRARDLRRHRRLACPCCLGEANHRPSDQSDRARRTQGARAVTPRP